MSEYIIGIDPGVSGAIAGIDPANPSDCWVEDMPVVEVKVAGSKRRIIDPSGLARLLMSINIDKVILEKIPSAIIINGKSRMGASTSFQLGRGLGICEGVLAGRFIPYLLVTPQAWKGAMLAGTSKDKGAALLTARRMFPSVDLSKKKHDGRAEALLMAQFGVQTRFGAKVGAK